MLNIPAEYSTATAPPISTTSEAQPRAKQVTISTIMWGVFLGNILSAVAVGIVYAILTAR